MSKKALINGNQYYSAKTVEGSTCYKCQRHIHSKNSYYSIKFPRKFLCNSCYRKLVSNHVKKQMIEAITIDTETIIYVGVKGRHICNNAPQELNDTYAKFDVDGKQFLTLPIKVCNSCGRIILSGKYYEKNKQKLTKYSFINSRTGKPYLEIKASENYVPGFKSNTTREIPNSVIWAMKHPFQGGGCSGK